MKILRCVLATTLILSLSCKPKTLYTDWNTYLGDFKSNQYSELDQINTSNVQTLDLAWIFDGNSADPENRSQIQCNPLIVNGVVFATTASLRLVALDGTNGMKLWEFDPFENDSISRKGVNRGLMYHQGHEYGEKQCVATIYYGVGRFVYAVNASNGTVIKSFANGGLDLQSGLSENEDLWVTANTPGIIYDDLLIIGGRVSESTQAAPGHIRAFDVHTGAQRWIFHTIPKPGEFGYETWPEDAYKRIGGANVWTGMSLDEENGIVYCPTGSAAFDFYGGDRHGDNLFANSLIALDAKTGDRIWHFQTIHHDMWDKDLPTPPNLITVLKDGIEIPAVAQATKNGLLFVFNRLTGEPIYPIEEMPVPPSQLRGELASKTQPVPTGYPRFSRFWLAEDDLANRTPEAELYAKSIWLSANKDAGAFEPPSEEGTIIFPGFDGGGEWGGAAFDVETHNLIINSNELPWRATMDEVKPASRGQRAYTFNCQSCHGDNFQGSQLFGNVPALTGLDDRLSLEEVAELLRTGKGIMPPFPYLDSATVSSLYDFINGKDETKDLLDEEWPYPYFFRSYEKLYAPDGYPIIKPPWGQLTSINMDKAEINWQIPLGEHKNLTDKGMPITGTEGYGGPIVTAGGLIFIAATMDEKFRAFDKNTGEELWSYDLPAAGYATPATYSADGKQYIVIACGGGKLGTQSGDYYLSFTLE